MSKTILLLCLLFLLIPSSSALQQSVGSLTIDISKTHMAYYGIRNDLNKTVTVTFTTTGDTAKYLKYEPGITLNASESRYVVISVPWYYYAGDKSGTIYALTEGDNGQVKVNIQLGKEISIINTPRYTYIIIGIGLITILMLILKNRKPKNKKYKINKVKI